MDEREARLRLLEETVNWAYKTLFELGHIPATASPRTVEKVYEVTLRALREAESAARTCRYHDLVRARKAQGGVTHAEDAG